MTALAVLVAAGLWITSGCDEVEPATETPEISPTSVLISKGQSIEFEAAQGYEYTWKIDSEHEAWGQLSASKGPRTVYTSIKDPGAGNTELVTLTLQSTILGYATEDSNTVSHVRTSEAFIKHMGVLATPESVSRLTYGKSVAFHASGGTQYTWSLQHEDWGTLSTRSGPDTTYTSRYTPGTNVTAIQIITVNSFESMDTSSVQHF